MVMKTTTAAMNAAAYLMLINLYRVFVIEGAGAPTELLASHRSSSIRSYHFQSSENLRENNHSSLLCRRTYVTVLSRGGYSTGILDFDQL